MAGAGIVQTSMMLSGASYAGGGVFGRRTGCRDRCFLTGWERGTASMCGGLRGASGCEGLHGTEVSTILGGTDAVGPERARAIMWDGNAVRIEIVVVGLDGRATGSVIEGASSIEFGAGLDMCRWMDNGGAWILKESRGIEDEKTEGEGDGETTLTSSSKLSRGVRGMVSLRGLRASHSERAGVEGADDPVGESG
jgi:hypothetical protein